MPTVSVGASDGAAVAAANSRAVSDSSAPPASRVRASSVDAAPDADGQGPTLLGLKHAEDQFLSVRGDYTAERDELEAWGDEAKDLSKHHKLATTKDGYLTTIYKDGKAGAAGAGALWEFSGGRVIKYVAGALVGTGRTPTQTTPGVGSRSVATSEFLNYGVLGYVTHGASAGGGAILDVVGIVGGVLKGATVDQLRRKKGPDGEETPRLQVISKAMHKGGTKFSKPSGELLGKGLGFCTQAARGTMVGVEALTTGVFALVGGTIMGIGGVFHGMYTAGKSGKFV